MSEPMPKGLPEKHVAELRKLAKQLLKEPPYDGRGGQARLAKAAGVSAGTLSAFLNGDRGAGAKVMIGLQRIAGRETNGITGVPHAPGAAPMDATTPPTNPDIDSGIALRVYDDLCNPKRFSEGYPRPLIRHVLEQLRWRHKNAVTYEQVLWATKEEADLMLENGEWKR
jgi:transcriptional regulator with XRE-family HTH domain